MLVTPIKTYRIRYYEQPSLEEVVCECLPIHQDGIVLAVAAKVVSLCEGNFFYSQAPGASIAVLPPADPFYTANRIHKFLVSHYKLKSAAVVIVDPKSKNALLAHSGFAETTKQQGGLVNLANAAATTMRENKTTPLALITNIPFVQFAQHKTAAKSVRVTALQ